ncbi:MAG: hypothetical protein K2G55_09425 [Lachnospiraceae bacterium]|nr:hypothetical protein [Lachnospiraceae bacterium]MDE7200593.1 hypothetical protein [Lachnospiraceae bacterium]
MYRKARNQVTQLQVLAELCDTNRYEIIRILVKNGERIPERVIKQLYKKLDMLDAQIHNKEQEYRSIVSALNGSDNKMRRKEHGNGI